MVFIASSEIPSWILAWGSVAMVGLTSLALIVSIISLFRVRRESPEYALVSRDGSIQSHRGFGKYGLHATLKEVVVSEDRPNIIVPEYTLKFDQVPVYFEVSTWAGAGVKILQKDPKIFSLRFIGYGMGSPVIDCNFKVQAF